MNNEEINMSNEIKTYLTTKQQQIGKEVKVQKYHRTYIENINQKIENKET